MSRPVDLIVQPAVSALASLATDRVLRTSARVHGRAAVRVSQLSGDVLSLGRWHVAPAGGAGIRLMRRMTGGRPVPAGTGFVGMSIALPHRSALVSTEALALAPPQVPNRYVRGLLEAFGRAGIAAVYPGRDMVTVAGRLAAMISFDVDAEGTCLFEAVLAVGRDFALLPALLDRADPRGVVRAPMLLPEHVTSLAAELGGEPSFAQVVAWLGAGYAERLELALQRRELTDGERAEIELVEDEFADGVWLRARTPGAHLDRHASVPTQLGFLDVHCAVAEGRLTDVLFAGDLIADAPGMARIEGALRGLAPDPRAVLAAVDTVLADPRHFVLGLGARPGEAMAGAIVRASVP